MDAHLNIMHNVQHPTSCIRLVTTIVLLLSFLVLSCKSGTSVKKGNIVGRIELYGESSSSGIQVVLFAEPDESQELSDIPVKFRNLAFNIEAKHLFDHRDRPWLQISQTDESGSFSIPNVVYGRYVLVYLKDGYDVFYHYNIEVNRETVQVSFPNGFSLNPITVVPSAIDGHYIFESNRTYRISNNLIALPSSNIEFQAGSMIFIDPSGSIILHGNCEFPDPALGIVTISSSDRLYELNVTPLLFGKFEISSNLVGIVVNGVKVSYSTEGLILKANEIACRNSVFTNNEVSCNAYMSSNLEISNSLFLRSDGVLRQGMKFFGVQNANASHNLFHNVWTSVLIEASRSIMLENNYFFGGNRQVSMRSDSDSIIKNNSFVNASIALVNTAKSNMEIYNNDIEATTCIYTFHTGNAGNTPTFGWTKANNNNFRYKDTAVEAQGYFYTSVLDYLGLDFKLNFWDTTSISAIEGAIVDAVDLGAHPDNNTIWPTIEYAPFRTFAIPNAGVQVSGN